MGLEFLSAAASSLGSFVGGMVNPFLQKGANKDEKLWQEKMYDRQRQDSLSDWLMQAEYNSPRAQMDRLKKAGLNPNMVYGSGADATMSSPVRSSSPGSYKPTAPQIDTQALTNSFMSIYDMKLKDAQVDNLAVAKSVQEQEILLKAAQTQNALQDSRTKDFDLKMKQDLKSINVDMAQESLTRARAEAEKAWSEATYQDETIRPRIDQAKAEAKKALNEADASNHLEKRVLQEIDNLKSTGDLQKFEIALNRLGITKGDPVYLRIFSSLFGKFIPKP